MRRHYQLTRECGGWGFEFESLVLPAGTVLLHVSNSPHVGPLFLQKRFKTTDPGTCIGDIEFVDEDEPALLQPIYPTTVLYCPCCGGSEFGWAGPDLGPNESSLSHCADCGCDFGVFAVGPSTVRGA